MSAISTPAQIDFCAGAFSLPRQEKSPPFGQAFVFWWISRPYCAASSGREGRSGQRGRVISARKRRAS